MEFSNIFPFILLTTVLIISIVKSSLALSLGLVGALSIVRFRTPIKEPEELAYLFLTIAVGLGLGAGQVLATVVSSVSIMILVAMMRRNNSSKSVLGKNVFVTLSLHDVEIDDKGEILSSINSCFYDNAVVSDLRRYDENGGVISLTYYIDLKDVGSLSELLDKIRKIYPDILITYIDQNQLPTI